LRIKSAVKTLNKFLLSAVVMTTAFTETFAAADGGQEHSSDGHRPFVSKEDCQKFRYYNKAKKEYRNKLKVQIDLTTQKLQLIGPKGPIAAAGELKISSGRELGTQPVWNPETAETAPRPPFCATTPTTDRPRPGKEARGAAYVKYDWNPELPEHLQRKGNTFPKFYRSKAFEVDMPCAVRIWPGSGYFIHGIAKKEEQYLGTPASAGCIRLSTPNACRLMATLQACGGMEIKIQGEVSKDKPVYTYKGERVERRLSCEDENLKRIEPYLKLCEKWEEIKEEKELTSNGYGDRKCGQIKAWYAARLEREGASKMASLGRKSTK